MDHLEHSESESHGAMEKTFGLGSAGLRPQARAQAEVAPLLRNDLESMSGVIDPFGSLWTASKPNSGHSRVDFDLP